METLHLQDLLEDWHHYRFYALAISAILLLFGLFWRPSRELAKRLPSETSEKGVTGIQANSSNIWHVESQITSHHDISSNAVKKARKRVSRPKIVRRGSPSATFNVQPLIFYFSLTGNTQSFAQDFIDVLEQYASSYPRILKPECYDLGSIDHETYFERVPTPPRIDPETKFFYVFLLPSYNIDTMLDNFLGLLKETHNDFRIDTAPLSSLVGYSVFSFGDSEGWPTVTEGFCLQGHEVDKWMSKLTAGKRAYPLGQGDVKSDASSNLLEWSHGLWKSLGDIIENGHLGEGVPGSGDAVESDEEEKEEEENKTAEKGSFDTKVSKYRNQDSNAKPRSIGDLEDLGGRPNNNSPIPMDFTTYKQGSAPKQMVPIGSPTYTSLTKQGYTIVGSHSGVKICRWTKSALRGRGSCYKYSFYGIQSHLCMETTPSLSCSNKCVFCWRHGTNPVGTTWRWEVDPPETIFNGAKEGHYQKIKMMRGVPGVRAERFQEAMRIRHCALSLVGEPIFYPHINDFVSLLHSEKISSFLVCNAQHPDQLAALKPVTQLYVSIDASNAESLRRIDRPLHRDFWQRFIRCLDILREKRFRMRTVFRLTLVKGFNIEEEVGGYADLVARGLPCFVEIKGVTYCGTSTSKSAGLTMQNVPFYDEIVAFVDALNDALARRGLDYGIAAEHAHSCCALIASRRFYVDHEWHTLIDYDKFFECWESGKDFAPEDYMGMPTPEWSLWGNGGFDPRDERVDRKGRPIEKA